MKAKIILSISLLILLKANVFAQDKKEQKVYNTRKWVHSVGIAANKYWYFGIPPSRNEINFESVGGKVDQSEGKGVVLDIKIQRKINKNYFGILINSYLDTKNIYWGQSVEQIQRDSLKWMSVYDNQRYLNIGL